MANSYAEILVKFDVRTIEWLKERVRSTSNEHREVCLGLARIFESAAAGVTDIDLMYGLNGATGATAATGTIVCTRANAAGNYVRFTSHGQTVTLTEGADFARGASDTTCGDNLATAINANTTLKRIMSAAAVTGTVTLTSRLPGPNIHSVAMSTDDATAFALTAFASGTIGTSGTFLTSTKYGNSIP